MTDDAMHLDFAVIADYALVDQAGKLSVLGIFQHIWVQQFPAMHPRLHLVLRLKGKRTEVGEHHVQIRLLDDRDTEILGGNGNVTFAEPPAGVTEIEAGAILVFDVPFPHAGAYRFQITVDGEMSAAVRCGTAGPRCGSACRPGKPRTRMRSAAWQRSAEWRHRSRRSCERLGRRARYPELKQRRHPPRETRVRRDQFGAPNPEASIGLGLAGELVRVHMPVEPAPGGEHQQARDGAVRLAVCAHSVARELAGS